MRGHDQARHPCQGINPQRSVIICNRVLKVSLEPVCIAANPIGQCKLRIEGNDSIQICNRGIQIGVTEIDIISGTAQEKRRIVWSERIALLKSAIAWSPSFLAR